MASDEFALFTREALLGGLPARRASTLLFAIESRTAYLVAQQTAAIILSEASAEARERTFLEALAHGRDLPLQPTIQDLERYAPQWTDLVPEDPGARAAIAHFLSTKYTFTYRVVPRLRSALGLDTDAVQGAYQRLYGAALATIFVRQVRPIDRLRWTISRLAGQLDALPTFWLAFILTLIIGAVNLALPIAVAGIGPLPGIALLVALGLINMVTIAAMVETVTRSGSIRYGNGFIGTVVADYLGNVSSAILSVVLTAFSFGLLLIFYIGISTTLADATRLPAAAWMVVLFLIGLYFLTRGSLNATIASTIIITTIDVILMLVLSMLAFSHMRLENLGYINLPWIDGSSFAPALFGALIGVILDVYSAHMLVAIFGKMLLQRDPSGRSVVRGHIAGIGFAIVLNVIWLLAVGGAIAPQVLARQSSTVLVPLAAEVGPLVRILGAIFVILSMGLGLIHFSLALFNLARERIAQRVALGGTRGRFLLSLIPVILVLLVAEWMVLTGTGSFAGILGFLGVMVHSLMAGIFPVLLLAASRRKGELVPGVICRALGHPLVVGGIYLLFLSNLFLHGLLIWQHPLERAGGVLVGLLMLGVTIMMIRRGSFAPRVVVELRDDRRPAGRPHLTITVAAQPAAAEVRLGYPDGEQQVARSEGPLPAIAVLRCIGVQLPAGPARELKVWAHIITSQGISEGLPALLTVYDGDERQDVDLGRCSGQIVLRLKRESCRLEITFPASSSVSVQLPSPEGAHV
jgi:amino acid permease